MEKTCTNHPESLALATCKACEKSICLMCVCDEKEGTFCSTKCVSVFREVSDWVDPGATPVPATSAAPAAAQPEGGSIFDDPAPSTAAATEEAPAAPAEQPEFEPLVTPGTKWRMIGSVCATHTDTQAVATCGACDRTVCALCVVEGENGTFCPACAESRKPAAPLVTAAPRPAPVAPPPPMKIQARRSSSGSGMGTGLKVAVAVVIVGSLAAGGFVLLNNSGNKPVENPLNRTQPVAKLDPVKVDPTKKVDPVKVDPVKVDPVKVDPVKVDPVKTDPTKVTPVRPYKKPDPPVRAKPPGVIANPWALQAPGAWFRMKTETASGDEVYNDVVLKEKTPESFTLSTSSGESKTSISPYWVKGEERLVIDGQTWLCEVREYENPPMRRWVLVEGKNAGAVLKEDSARGKTMSRRLWEHTIRFGKRAVDCLVVEGESNGAPYKFWYSAALPIGIVKEEAGGKVTSLIDFGDDASKKPPLPK